MIFTFRQKVGQFRGRLGMVILIAVFLPVFFFSTGTTKVLAAEIDTQLEKPVQVLLNGKPVNFDVSPILENGRVLVPFRAIGEALEAGVTWDGQNQTVTLTMGGVIVNFISEGTALQVFKEDLSTTRKKLNTDLLQLLDEKYLPPGQSSEDIKTKMQALKQFRFAGVVEQTVNGKAAGDMVYVYIYLKPPVNTHVIDVYVWEVTDRDEENSLAVAWVEVKNLEALALLESVRTIRTVLPPVTTTKSMTSVKLKIGDTGAFVNDRQVNLDVPACIISGRAMVPLRFISESLGAAVDWDEQNKTVHINTGK